MPYELGKDLDILRHYVTQPYQSVEAQEAQVRLFEKLIKSYQPQPTKSWASIDKSIERCDKAIESISVKLADESKASKVISKSLRADVDLLESRLSALNKVVDGIVKKVSGIDSVITKSVKSEVDKVFNE